MKIRYFSVLLAIMFAFVQLDAQVNNVKKKSQQNKNNRTTNNNNGGGGGTTPGSACLGACVNACASGCAQIGATVIIAGQQAYLDRKDEVPHMVSVDILPHGGYIPNNESFQIMPRVRGNWGMFSTDIRFNSLIEIDTADKLDFYNTTDWQILEFNPVITKNFVLRFGTGFMYEHYSKIFYNEHYLGADVLWDEFRYLVTAEGRWAKDYQSGASPRTEANIRFNYRYFKNRHFHCYVMLGGLYHNYYPEYDGGVENLMIQTGVTVNFH